MKYSVFLTDAADAEADAIANWMALNVSPRYAARWYAGLIDAIGELEFMPRRHSLARENDQSDVEVRRLLYFGPSKRRGGTVYRVLFHIVEPEGSEEEGSIHVLHIWHGARVTAADHAEKEEKS